MSRMVLAAFIAFVAGRFTAPAAAPAKPVVTVRTETKIERIAMHCPADVLEVEDEPYEDPDAIEAEDTEAIRLLETESKRLAALERSLGVQGALRGQIKDAKTRELMPGVTVVASNGSEAFTAITEENGTYEIGPIPSGTYTVTMYYLDATIEYFGVAVASQKVTPLYAEIDPPQIEPHGHGITIEDDYVRNIPTGRTFENVLGAAANAEEIDEGVSFDGSEATEDAYYE